MSGSFLLLYYKPQADWLMCDDKLAFSFYVFLCWRGTLLFDFAYFSITNLCLFFSLDKQMLCFWLLCWQITLILLAGSDPPKAVSCTLYKQCFCTYYNCTSNGGCMLEVFLSNFGAIMPVNLM